MAHLTLQAPPLPRLKQAMHWARLRIAGLEPEMAERAVRDRWSCDLDNQDLLVVLARLVAQSSEDVPANEVSIFFRFLEQCYRDGVPGCGFRITARTLDAFRLEMEEHMQRVWQHNTQPARSSRSRRVYALAANPRVEPFETVDLDDETIRIVELRKSYQL